MRSGVPQAAAQPWHEDQQTGPKQKQRRRFGRVRYGDVWAEAKAVIVSEIECVGAHFRIKRCLIEFKQRIH
jgi:dihydrodipicolinate reductase